MFDHKILTYTMEFHDFTAYSIGEIAKQWTPVSPLRPNSETSIWIVKYCEIMKQWNREIKRFFTEKS